MKYVEAKIVFAEIPNEITLAINISGCPIRCKGCHSKYLWEDIGESLDRDSLYNLIEKNNGISCVAFMGGDANVPYLQSLFHWVRTRYPELKIAWYSGQEGPIKRSDMINLDYIKIGPYKEELGPLNSKDTNQRMYKLKHAKSGELIVEDITKMFLRND